MLKLQTMETIIANSNNMKQTVISLRNELNVLRKAYSDMRLKNLNQENAELSKQVEQAKKKLIQLEVSKGVKQIPIPGSPASPGSSSTTTTNNNKPVIIEAPKQPKKEKPKPQTPTTTEEVPVHVGRLDLRVGQIMQVEKHPDADSLYVSKIQCGDPAPAPALRTVVSGLVKHVPITELHNRKVVVLCNLKPAKMRGILSEAMVMCASSAEAVEVLNVPDSSEVGDRICCEGFDGNPDAQLNPKKKIFEAVAVDLKTNGSMEATYKGGVLCVVGKGPVRAKSLKNVHIK